MPYIARTDGGQSVLELREGTLTDLSDAERSNWLPVNETRPPITAFGQIYTTFDLVVGANAVTMNWQVASAPAQLNKLRLKKIAADASWRKREAGLTLPNGVRVDTSADSLTMIIGAVQSLERGYIQEPVEFCALSGPVQATLADLQGVWAAIAAYVQASFAARAAAFAAIDAGTITTEAQAVASV